MKCNFESVTPMKSNRHETSPRAPRPFRCRDVHSSDDFSGCPWWFQRLMVGGGLRGLLGLGGTLFPTLGLFKRAWRSSKTPVLLYHDSAGPVSSKMPPSASCRSPAQIDPADLSKPPPGFVRAGPLKTGSECGLLAGARRE